MHTAEMGQAGLFDSENRAGLRSGGNLYLSAAE